MIRGVDAFAIFFGMIAAIIYSCTLQQENIG